MVCTDFFYAFLTFPYNNLIFFFKKPLFYCSVTDRGLAGQRRARVHCPRRPAHHPGGDSSPSGLHPFLLPDCSFDVEISGTDDGRTPAQHPQHQVLLALHAGGHQGCQVLVDHGSFHKVVRHHFCPVHKHQFHDADQEADNRRLQQCWTKLELILFSLPG